MTSTTVGRAELQHPNLASTGGSGLWASINLLWTLVSNHLPGRWFTAGPVPNGTPTTFTHGFGVPFSELSFALYTGTWPQLTRVADPTGAGWTIAASGGASPAPNKDVIVTTPVAGGPFTFALVALHAPSSSGGSNTKKGVITSTSPVTFTHSFGVTPQDVYIEYYDGTQILPVDPSAVVTAISATQITVNPGGFAFGGGKYMNVYVSNGTVAIMT